MGDAVGVDCGGDCSCDCGGCGDSCYQCTAAGDAGCCGEGSGCFPTGCYGVDASGSAAGGAVPNADPAALAPAPDVVSTPLPTAVPAAAAPAAIDVEVCDVPAPALAPACCCGNGDGSCCCDDIAKCCVCPLFVPAPVSAPEAIPSEEEARRRRLRYTVGLICLILGIAAVNLLLLLGLRFSAM